MHFEVDDQTRRDLELFGDNKHSDSIFSFFDYTRTGGGRQRLAEWLRTPTNDLNTLRYRRDAIRFFREKDLTLTLSSHQADFIEHYFRLGVPVLRNNPVDALFKHISVWWKPSNDYSASRPCVSIEGLTYPLVENAVANHVHIDGTHNLVLLTGPNMAGKSTFLKSLGLAVYLAHAGFPVPARRMQTSLYNGLVTTINLSDSVKLGYSHFYSEVVRIRETAEKIRERKTVFVIFDELFRGTNVKDAFDASLLIVALLIVASFARIRSCSFFVSTHITEIARELAGRDNIRFGYFDSRLIDGRPVYSYTMHEGVSEERLGLLIVKNEKITDILDSIGSE